MPDWQEGKKGENSISASVLIAAAKNDGEADAFLSVLPEWLRGMRRLNPAYVEVVARPKNGG
ncbi:MAG: hypothetical protein H7Y88_08585 [Phycisphaerales bacterium]|nr:hypothetical protein [Phycisphaerales bacterium]